MTDRKTARLWQGAWPTILYNGPFFPIAYTHWQRLLSTRYLRKSSGNHQCTRSHNPTMLTFPGYQIIASIYESANSMVYRGVREKDNQAVILKVLKEDYPTPAELTRYKSEYEIARSLDLEGAVKAYALEAYQKTLVIIFEDFGGISLKMLANLQKFTLAEFLQIAIAIADSLGHIHAANIVHKDINPANIVFNPQSGKLKIIDFGISTVLTRENPTLKNPNVLEGTLAYMSPEQTGRMNRSLDYRTDFYSLGVTFYELLTRQLPFIGEDAVELVHCHIAKQPVPPYKINGEIPIALSNIVMKLLAKAAEERYQSAWGIKADLEECLTQLQTKGQIFEFALGRRDISDKFQIPQKLYGREREVDILLAAFERVASPSENRPNSGASEMMLVSGYSGIGKSALVQEIYKPITRQRGYFIAGKFDQFQRNIPYSAIVIALRSLIEQLLAESESQLAKWKEKLLAAFGPNGQIIIDVIPEVELIVGKQFPVQELGPAESQNRFNLVFQNFIRTFCAAEHPLVIFLDDLQWADLATLKLIEVMMTDEEIRYLLAIGAYRDNEVDASHPLTMTLDSLVKAKAIVNNISLAPLAIAHVTHLIAETLQSDIKAVTPLAELVVRKTQGNPFFVNQFLKTLYQENLLTFHPPSSASKGGWQWNVAQIEAMNITDNVVELMIQKLKKLPEATQQVLRLAACVGNTFDLNTLSIIHEKPLAATFKHLLPAIQEGLILPTSELETTEEEAINSSLVIQTYKFLHDRVQQSGYALIDEQQQTAVHLQIGRLLLANISLEQRAERVFEIADHLNSGRKLIADDREKVELVVLNLTAARKAKDATAYTAARNYLRIALEILPGNIWQDSYELAITLHKELANIEYLNGNFEESEALIEVTISQAKSNLEKAEVYNTIIVQYTLLTKYEEAIQAGLKALRLLGVYLAEKNLTEAVSAEFAEAQANLANKKIASLIHAKKMNDPAKKVALKLLGNMGALTFLSSQELWKLTVIKAINLSLKYGFVAGGSYCYSCYGIILNSILGDYQSAYEFGRLAIALSENSNNLSQNCQDSVIFANYLNCWVKPIKTTIEINSEGYKIGLQSGNLQWTGYNRLFQTITYFFQGMNLTALLEDMANSLHFCQKTKNLWSIDVILANKSAILNLMGQEDELSEEQHVANFHHRKSMAALCEFYVLKSQILYLDEQYSEALKASDRASEIINYLMGHISSAHHNFYRSLILTALYPAANESERKDYWQQIEANQKQMKIWAENCPENFAHKFWLGAAEIARILGRDLEAMDLYDRAIATARENDFIQNEALAAERAAFFWLAKGKEEFAQLYLTKAHYNYQLWGAKRKVEDLEEKYSHLLSRKRGTSATKDPFTKISSQSAPSTSNSRDWGAALDLATVMKASQAISGEIVLANLLDKLMKILIENAGAETGMLVLPKNGEFVIEAVATKDAVRAGQSIPVSTSGLLPVSAIDYVARTQKDVVLNDASREELFNADSYIIQHQPKSLLCAPIVYQGKLTAILYLENNLTAGAFTPKRVEVLRMLSAQTAIALENALLYASLEQRVEERTQELNEKNTRLTQEIIERQKIEEALRLSEERFRAIFESTDDSIVVFDKHYNCLYANEAWLDNMKKSRELVIGKNFSEIFKDFPSGISLWMSRFETVFENRKSLHFEDAAIVDKRAKYSESTISPIKDATGNVFAVGLVYRDITERKLTENALQQSEERYRAVVEDQTELICRFLPNFTLTFVNGAYCRYFNKKPDKLLGHHFMPDVEPEDKEKLEQFIASLHAENPIGTIEYRIVFGKLKRWHQWTFRAIFDEESNFIEFQGVGQDITARKQAEEALRESEAALKQQAEQLERALQELKQTQAQLVQTERMSSLGQLVAGIAHEINNPVNFIHGNIGHVNEYTRNLLELIDLYQQQYPQPAPKIIAAIQQTELDYIADDLPKIIASMKTGTERIRGIVHSLRNFSRLDEAELKEVDVHEGIENTLMLLQHRFKASKGNSEIQLLKEYGELPKIECYAGLLNQVFLNIIVNAIDALENTKNSRAIAIKTEVGASASKLGHQPKGLATISASQFVTIRISDNGPGMTEDVKMRIFDPFFTTKPVGKSIGMGLSICHQIVVKQHQGAIECVSVPSQGTEFIIKIPQRLQLRKRG